jgi:hypothetical protein
MKNIAILLFLMLSAISQLSAQETFEHPVLNCEFVKNNRISNITFVDSFASSYSSFNYRYRSLDFSYSGILLKSLDTYDSLSSSREMWYFYYDDNNRLSSKVLRTINNDVSEAIHYQYDTLNRLIKREQKMFDADSVVISMNHSTFTWEGDSVRLEHNHKDNSFEIAFFNKSGIQTGVYAEYRKSFFNDGRLREIMGVGGGFNDSDKEKYRIKYLYNNNLQLTKIETYHDVTNFYYDSNGFLVSMVEQDIKSGKIKNRTSVSYKRQ